MKNGNSIIIEKCASGFIVRPMTATVPGGISGLDETYAFSDIGRTDYHSDLTMLAWIKQHFEALDNMEKTT